MPAHVWPAAHVVASRSTPEGTQNQAEALRAEDVQVERSAMGELSVDFSVYGWFPEILPSEQEEADGDGDGAGR